MPDATSTHPMSYNGWTMRVRHATRAPARLMLLLHGWTGDENSMWVFANRLPADLWIAAPRAPHAASQGGYSWRPLDSTRDGDWGFPTLADLRPAADGLIRLVDELAASIGLDAGRFDLAGFSQGGALVNVLALLHPQRVHRAAVLAGFMPAGVEDLLERRALAGLPFFVAHGTRDTLVPFERARGSIELLERGGAQVTFCEAEVGHKLSADCLRGLEAFFQA